MNGIFGSGVMSGLVAIFGAFVFGILFGVILWIFDCHAQMDAARLVNAELAADALRVREQFAQIQSTRSPDLERSHYRVERCERLLSEGYGLANEGEGLLREREARLRARM